MRRTRVILITFTAVLLAALLFAGPARPLALAAFSRLRGRHTLAEQLGRYGPAASARLTPRFAAAGLAYPPQSLLLVAFKAEKRLEVHARNSATDTWRFITSYSILAASGGPGPKLREGDGQVPEGFYRIESLNPNSLYHLAMRLDYPNHDDRAQAALDHRTQLGGDIMIHGKSASIGCLAMGDSAIEELFVLAADSGVAAVDVVMSPADLRASDLRDPRP